MHAQEALQQILLSLDPPSKVLRLAAVIIREQGTDNEKHGLLFGLYPQRRIDQADLLITSSMIRIIVNGEEGYPFMARMLRSDAKALSDHMDGLLIRMTAQEGSRR